MMLEKAIKKLESEIKQNNSDPYIKVIGDFLIQHVNNNPLDSEKILFEEKTISKSLDEMTSVAKKKAVKGRAMLMDQEGFAIVLKYYGIDGVVKAVAPPIAVESTPPIVQPKELEKKTSIGFDVKLEDFM